MKCTTCSYDKKGYIIKVCGPCEEEAIRQRINWWQEGKKKLKEKNGVNNESRRTNSYGS